MRKLPRPTAAALLSFVAVTTAPTMSGAPPEVSALVSSFDGPELSWSHTLTPPAGDPRGRLTAAPWRKPLPDLEVRLLGGERVRLSALRGSVVVLNSWATWCGPCREELPWLQQLYDANRERGLVAMAINVGDRPVEAIPFADELGLSMPIGIYDPAMTPTLFPQSVPSLVVADRRGRLQGRWNGFEPQHLPVIESLVERLLADPEDPETEVASVWAGEGSLRVRWMRQVPGLVEDVGAIEAGDGVQRILVSHGNLFATYDADGLTVEQWVGDRAAGKLRLAPTARADRPLLASFRPGGKRIVIVDGPGVERQTIDVASNLFDLAWLPDGWLDVERAFVAATVDGPVVIDDEGVVLASPEGYGTSSAVVRSAAGLLVLETSGRLSRFGAGFERLGEIEVPPGSWVVLPRPDGRLAVGGGEVRAMTRGDWTDADGTELAVATRNGRLQLLAEQDGRLLFDAEWPEISALATVDLERDGEDELVVGAGRSLAVLSRVNTR